MKCWQEEVRNMHAVMEEQELIITKCSIVVIHSFFLMFILWKKTPSRLLACWKEPVKNEQYNMNASQTM